MPIRMFRPVGRWIVLFAVLGVLGWNLFRVSADTVQTTIFSDAFSGTLSQWTTPGSASVANGQLSLPISLDMIRAGAGTATWTDYHFTSAVTITNNAVGIVFRSPDVNNGYMWQLNISAGRGQGVVKFHTKINGTYNVVKTVSYPSLRTGTAYSVEIVTSGSTLSLYIGGTLIDTETDSTFPQGVIGYRTGSTETGLVDNVTVYTLTTPTPTPTPTPVPTPTPTPAAPTAFQAGAQWNAGKPFAALSWTASATGVPAGAVLERRATGTSTFQRLAGLNASASSFNDYWIQPNTGYDYRLSAFNSAGSSNYVTTSYPPKQTLPLGYVSWAQSSLSAASGGSLAAGTLWNDIGTNGVPNAIAYAFSDNSNLFGAPGELFVQPGSSGSMQVWGNSFAAHTDLHYALQGSPDLASWQTYLDETSPAFSLVGSGWGSSAKLLTIDPLASPAPLFFRWSVNPNVSASAAPAGMLVNGLSGTSGATLTQSAPVFSWEVGTESQTAYEILVATSPSLLTEGAADVWNSGKISGTGSLNIPFAGLTLQSNKTYYWTVRTWDSAGVASAFGAVQSFTTGALTSTYQTDLPKVVQDAIAPVSVVQKGTGWYFVDFGKDAFGTVKLNIPSPVARQVITVGMGEFTSATNTVNTAPTLYARYQSQSITMQSGVTSYTVTPTWTALYSGSVSPPSYIGQVTPFRYVEIKNVPEPFTASQITQLAAHVPFDDSAATFTSSDALLNSIWALCKYTTKATTFAGVYVDGDRERIPYEADSYMHMLNQYCMDRDYATARVSMEYLLSHGTWPTEWSHHMIFMAWLDYLYTGDLRSLQAKYATLQTKLLGSRIRSDGLYTGTTATGSGSAPTDIVDWPATERDGYDMVMPVKTVTSAFYYQALVYMQQIATALGKTSDASNYQTAAALTLGSLNSKLWDSTNGRYLDGMSSAGAVDAHSSLHGNMFPLAFGMVPAANQASVLSYIEGRGMLCSVYGAQYFLEALYSQGAGTYALSLFDSTAQRSWHTMLNAGTTMTGEAWDQSLKTNEDWNHAWGAAAGNIIPRWLMGVRPLTPGFQTFVIQPQPGTLSSASMTMPTVRGPVSVNVLTNTSTDFSLSVSIPANTTANVGLPTLGSTSTTVSVDGLASMGTISGNTLWINNVTPGPHLFEHQP